MTTDEARAIIVARRRALGLTRAGLSERSRKSPATIKRLETGGFVSGPSARAVIVALGLDVDTLLPFWTPPDAPDAPAAPLAEAAPLPAAPSAPPSPAPSTHGTVRGVRPVAAPEAAGDGSVWSTAWRRFAIACAAVGAFSVVAVDRVRPAWSDDPRVAFELAKASVVANEAATLACAAATGWILGMLALGQATPGRHRLRCGRSLRIPFLGRSVELPTMSTVRTDGRPARPWVGGLVGVAAIPALVALAHLGPLAIWPSVRAGDIVRSAPVAPLWNLPPGSALASSGARIGDELSAVDGIPVRTRFETAVLLFQEGGPPHVLTVKREAAGPADRARHRPRVDVDLPFPARPAHCDDACRSRFDLDGMFTTSNGPAGLGPRLDGLAREVAVASAMLSRPHLATCALIGMPEMGQSLPPACAPYWPLWSVFVEDADWATWIVVASAWGVVALGTLTSAARRFAAPSLDGAARAARGLPGLATSVAAVVPARGAWAWLGFLLPVAPMAFALVVLLVEVRLRDATTPMAVPPLVAALVAAIPLGSLLDVVASARRRAGPAADGDGARLAARVAIVGLHALPAALLLTAACVEACRASTRLEVLGSGGWLWSGEAAAALVLACAGVAAARRHEAVLDGLVDPGVAAAGSWLVARLAGLRRQVLA